jgi:hypothetical protein
MGIDLPIVQVPLGSAAGPKQVAPVSEADLAVKTATTVGLPHSLAM